MRFMALGFSLVISAGSMPQPVVAAKPRPAILDQIAKALGDQRVFVTKIDIASSARILNEGNSGRNLTHFVDTEVYPTGEIRYHARRENQEKVIVIGSLLFGNVVLRKDQVTIMLRAESRVALKEADHEDDRIEYPLVGYPGGEYGKLKFMFGKGYETSLTLDTAMSLICRVLHVESWDRLITLTEQHRGAMANLESARTAMDRLRCAQELREVIRGLVGVTEGDKAAAYSREADTLTSMIQSLEPKAREEERVALDAEYVQMKKRWSQLFDNYSMAYGTPAEKQQGQQLLAHLTRMEQNRLRAAELGSRAAAPEAADLRVQIQRIQSKLQ